MRAANADAGDMTGTSVYQATVPMARVAIEHGSIELEVDTARLSQLGIRMMTQPRTSRDAMGKSELTFPLSERDTFVGLVDLNTQHTTWHGTITSIGAIAFVSNGTRYTLGNFGVGTNEAGVWNVISLLEPSVVRRAFMLKDARVDYSTIHATFMLDAQLYFSTELLHLLQVTALEPQLIGSLHVQATIAEATSRQANSKQTYGDKLINSVDVHAQITATGADVIVSDLHEVNSYGSSGVISAFSLGTRACNVGTQPIAWEANTNQHPVIAQNLYRLRNGTFEQIGMSWLKHGFFAQSAEFCSGLGGCTGDPTGASLGVGCSDPYSANLNGDSANLGPRSDVNAFTGNFPYPFQALPADPVIGRRLQVHNDDLDPVLNPGALYFIESCYVSPDDAASGNQFNNASHRQVLIDLIDGTYVMSHSLDFPTIVSEPAIQAWSSEVPAVTITALQLPNGADIRVAVNVTALGGSVWRYDYAVFNLNSDRSIGRFSVPIFTDAEVTNTTFHDVDYHSGEIYDGTDWPVTIANNQITWATDTFVINENANAIRWGTMYNFSFEINAAPVGASVSLGLFKPGGPTEQLVAIVGPPSDPPDCNMNNILDACDIDCGPIGGKCNLIGCGLSLDCADNGIPDECEPDSDVDGVVDSCDLCEGGDDSLDADFDLVPDFCDECPGFDDHLDTDVDTVPDDCDNCPADFNPNQLDDDNDGVGNRCDQDFCTPVILDEHFLTDPFWATSVSAATGGFWDWGFPAGDGTRKDPIDDFDMGNGCYLTENNIDTGDRDVDNGTVILTSPVFELAQGNVALSYAYWLGTTDLLGEDSLTVQLSEDQGSSWVSVAIYTNDVIAWQLDTIDVSAVFPNALTLRIRFFATDAGFSSLMEAGIDAVRITIECLLDCVSDAECDDGNLCTDDLCISNICTFPNNSIACDDGDACTTVGVCAGGQCVGSIPPPCLGGECTDCDGNGFRDDCEGLPDCNLDGIPDQCQFADCNNNSINDVCDIMNGTSNDCDGGPLGNPQDGARVWGGLCINCHGVDGGGGFGPNIRDHSRQSIWLQLLAPTTHTGGAHPEFNDQDFADLQAFLSTTGSRGRMDRTPDECQLLSDCDGDGTTDGCALDTQWQHDLDFDGIPEECSQVETPLAWGTPKNRYISFVAGGPSVLDPTNLIQAIRLTSPDDPGVVKWVDVPNQSSIARLSCVPVFRDWGSQPIHIGDADIGPNRNYWLQGIAQDLDANNEFLYSQAVTIDTVKLWGDVVGTLDGFGWTPPNNIVNATDITAIVITFRLQANAPPLMWGDLHSEIPNGLINAADILLVVNAFRLTPFPYTNAAALCNDLCPIDPLKIDPGDCGCGFPDEDLNGNQISDCLE